MSNIECDLVVLGGGPGGYSAAFRAADLGLKTVLVERYPTLGGVCLNVGCIPSKALLHAAAIAEEAAGLAAHGISFGKPEIDLGGLRGWKDNVVGKLTDGLASMAKGRKVEVVQGIGRFRDSQHLEVASAGNKHAGEARKIKFARAIIAAGSHATRLPFMPEDPRIVTSTGALALPFIPKRMLVIGGGIIGLEMATIYSALGAGVDIVEALNGLMPGPDRDLVKVWEKKNAHRFERIMLETKVVSAEAKPDGIWVNFDGPSAPTSAERYDLVLEAIGRTPNGKLINAKKASLEVSEKGFIPVDKQMRSNVSHIFAIGDIADVPMLAHKAVHQGHIAAEVAAGGKNHFDLMAIPSVAYTAPEVAWVGLTELQAKTGDVEVEISKFPWAASGRAIANNRDEGFTKLLFDRKTRRIVGGGIVGMNAGDLISEITLAIEMGADAIDIARTIHPHPTLSETIGMAAEVREGVCTDLPKPRR